MGYVIRNTTRGWGVNSYTIKDTRGSILCRVKGNFFTAMKAAKETSLGLGNTVVLTNDGTGKGTCITHAKIGLK